MVHEPKDYSGEAIVIRCAHGDTVLYPIALVELEVAGRKVIVEAAVSKTLPTAVLLGTDVVEFPFASVFLLPLSSQLHNRKGHNATLLR